MSSSRIALVTGGSRGIGLAIARGLAADGHRVVIGSRTDPGLDEFVWVPLDVTDPESIDAAFSAVEDQLGPVELLVANAGITRDTLVLRMSDDDFDTVINANLAGSFKVAKRAVKRMMKGRFGRMVFISSVVGSVGQAGQANYAASKAGLVGLARSLAREFASRGITANIVAPGPIATDMLDALSDDQKQAITDSVPVGRVGTPDEVAAAVRFLCSDEAGYITGVVLPVDGGLGMGGG
ncbi:MAG: beta-ketoacyl-ACP reductase [Actinomycetia bacterium]|nr:beta-ketoacyl-ACP reductase [Actinomycetes bacterium]